MDFMKTKIVTIDGVDYTLGLMSERVWLNAQGDINSGYKLGDLIFAYLPYFLISVQGKGIVAKTVPDGAGGRWKERVFSPDWIEKSLSSEVASELYEAGYDLQTLTDKEVKNSSGRQKSPKSKPAKKQADVASAK